MRRVVLGFLALFVAVLFPPACALALDLDFNGQLVNRYDKAYQFLEQGPLTLTDHFRMDFALEATSKFKGPAQLFVRAAMTKYWNGWDLQNQVAPGVYNLNTDSKWQNADLYLDEAFVNYEPSGWFTLLGGRLPTVDGAPVTFYKGPKAQAIFPKLAVGAELDGAIGSFDIKAPFPGNDKLSLLVGYSPYLLENYNGTTIATTARPLVDNGNVEAETLAPLGLVALNYKIAEPASKHFIQAMIFYSWLNYLHFPDATDSVSNLALSVNSLVAFFEADRFLWSRFDFSFTYLDTAVTSDGSVTATGGANAGQNLGGFGTQSPYARLFGNKELFAVLYHIPWKAFPDPTAGAELLLGSPDSFYFDRNPEDVSQFYGTRGVGWHVYGILPLDDKFAVRLGYRHQNLSDSFIGLGPTVPDHTEFDTYYADFRANF